MTTPDTSSFTPRQSDPFEPGAGGHGRRRLVLVLVLVLLAAAGGWALFLRPKSATQGGPKPTASLRTSVSPAPTPDPQTSDNLDTAFRAIYAKRTQAIVEGHPELVDDIYLPDCNCYELKSIIQEGIRRAEHHVGYQPTVLLVREQDTTVGGGNVASVRAVTEQGPYTITDDSGNVMDHDPGWAPQSTSWNLFRSGPGSAWKVGFLLVEGSPERTLGPGWRSAVK
jgi:hypothetical protein